MERGASGTSNPINVTITGNTKVTANFNGLVLNTPSGTQTSWDNTFSWTGYSAATYYFVQVQTADGTTVLNKWYTADAAGCAGGTACAITPSETQNLANGGYKWRIRDYGPYGYGPYTAYTTFDLNVACYSLTTAVNPASGGTINVSPAPNCSGKYTAGSVVSLSAIPGTGFTFTDWSGDASGTSNPVTVTITGDTNVTANFNGLVLNTPSGTQTSWDNTFSWTGYSAATYYFVQVQTVDGTYLVNKWYTADAAGCAGGTACAITPSETQNLANGGYKWRIRDYGPYGYGPYTAYTTFDLNVACYSLTTAVNPASGGTVNASPAPNCGGQYTAGTVVALSAVPGTGFVFTAGVGMRVGRATRPR